jgi:hypothetical protein
VRLATWLETPVIDQRDKRWKALMLGNSDSTIGAYGCLLSCFSMLAGITPPEMNSRMIASAAFGTPGCAACANTFDVRKMLATRVPAIADYSGRYPYSPFPAASSARLVKWLKAGNAAVIEVDINPNNASHEMHFVLGVSAFGHGDTANIIIADPWHGDQTTLAPRYGVNLARAIVRAIYYGEGTP